MGNSGGKIVLNEPNKAHYSGDMVTGKFVLTETPANNLKDIILTFEGEAERKQVIINIPGHRKDFPVTSSKSLIDNFGMLSLLKRGDVGEIPFSIQVPSDAPSTFHGTYGGVTHYLKAKLVYPFPPGTKYVKSDEVIVIRPLNLAMFPELKLPITKETSKRFCCLCCTSGPLTVVARLPKTAFTKGETIPIFLEIKNTSDVNIRQVVIELREEIVWDDCRVILSGAFDREKSVLESVRLPGVGVGSSGTWNKVIEIPFKSFPYFGDECLIQIRYEIVAIASGMYSSLKLHIPIKISDVVLDA